jgi:acyl-CoA dehydrogenase
MRRTIFTDEHELFRASFRTFVQREAVPHTERWESEGMVDRSFWEEAAAAGFVGFEAPVKYGGLGVRDFRYNAIIDEEMMYAAAVGDGFPMANDILMPYLLELADDEQKARWLPGFTAGKLIAAVAMTEPQTGSDLRAIATTARRDGENYVVNGAKTFITSGIQADLIVTVVRDVEMDGGFSLLVVERDTPGFTRGTPLRKVGHRAQDTSELFFSDAVVPSTNRLGDPGQGMSYLKQNLAQERLSMAVSAVAASEKALELTIDYYRVRTAFGKPIGSHQANRFSLAEMIARVSAERSHVDRCIEAHGVDELTAVDAAAAKLTATELQCEVLDRCLQLHGGFGYMDESLISRLWRDARAQRIYGGTSEIMKEIIGRGAGL